jgi:hypothetical protein
MGTASLEFDLSQAGITEPIGEDINIDIADTDSSMTRHRPGSWEDRCYVVQY